MSLLYLYAVLEDEPSLGPRLSAAHIRGLDPEAIVRPLEAVGLVAAVSDVPTEQFSDAALNALARDLGALAPLAVRHEEVVRALHSEGFALIPMSFGAVYRSEESIARLLDERRQAFTTLLDQVRGKGEWDVQFFLDRGRLRVAAVESSPALRALAGQEAAASPGRAYLLRKQMERSGLEEADRVLEEAVNRAIGRLSAVSDRTQIDDLPPTPIAERQLVAKAAFLVTEDLQATFQSTVAELDRTCQPLGLSLELKGPWAPYSFVGQVDGGA